MISGYILIGAILILGGIIAVSGDRIGTKVGKARLTLFKLRPRQTATLVTIVAGTLLSATVLTLIFGASEQLRTGVFDLQKIQRKLSDTKENLDRALEQKDRVQRELEIARNAQLEAKNLVSGIDQSLKDELLKQSIAAQNYKNTEAKLQAVSTGRNDLVREVAELSSKRGELTAGQQEISLQVRELKEYLGDLEGDAIPLKKQSADLDRQTAQLRQELNTVGVQLNLVAKTQQLQLNENSSRRLARESIDRIGKITSIESQLKTRQDDLLNVETQLKQLDQKIAVRRAMLKEKDKQHQQLEREFQTRATQLKTRDRQLKELEIQLKSNGSGLASLEKEVNNIEQEYRKIRQGNIGILRNQVLASSIIKASNPTKLNQDINNLLMKADLNAVKATHPEDLDLGKQIIELTPDRLVQLQQQLANGGDYVVRIFSVDNYMVGDNKIEVFADATLNRKLLDRDRMITKISIDPTQMNEVQIRQQFNILLVQSQLRARQMGILDDRPQIGDGQLTTYIKFLEQVKIQKSPIEIRAIVSQDTYTLGPLVIKLIAIANDKILFSTYFN